MFVYLSLLLVTFCLFILTMVSVGILICLPIFIAVIHLMFVLSLNLVLLPVLSPLRVFLLCLLVLILTVICLSSFLLVVVMFLFVVSGFLLVRFIVIVLLILTTLSRLYIFLLRRFLMKLNVYTVFDRIDGAANQLWLVRSDNRMVYDFVNQIDARNRDLKSKGFPLIRLDDFEIRRVGVFEDTTCQIEPCLPPQVVPFSEPDASEAPF